MSSRRVAISMPLSCFDAGRAYLVSAQIGPPLRGRQGLDLGSQDRQVPTQLLGDDGSRSGVVPGELNRQNWSRPSVPGFRFVAHMEERLSRGRG